MLADTADTGRPARVGDEVGDAARAPAGGRPARRPTLTFSASLERGPPSLPAARLPAAAAAAAAARW
ncbi:hypothetical protein GCM10010279_43280 [Streptomyces mutabilis]|nr:hypothetical protein GCM10010279_43280 [Streptomyces mutabilis]